MSKRLQSCCTRNFNAGELERYARQIAQWDELDDATREIETCDKLLVGDGLWAAIEDARDMQQAILWHPGGKGDQPYAWWVRTRALMGFLAEQDAKALKSSGASDSKGELDALAEQLGLKS